MEIKKTEFLKFYHRDFFGSENVMMMDNREIGIYMRLLTHQWDHHSLPKESGILAKIANETPEEFDQIWFDGPLEKCFESDEDGRLYNPRLRREWEEMAGESQAKSMAGKKGAKAKALKNNGNSSTAEAPLKHTLSTAKAKLKHPLSYKDKDKDKDKDVKSLSTKKRVDTPEREITDTVKVERSWVAEYEKQLGGTPHMSPAKDRSILKIMIKTHGFDAVMRKVPLHVAGRKLLTIGGFQTTYNDLGLSPPRKQTTGSRKLAQVKSLMSHEPGANLLETNL